MKLRSVIRPHLDGYSSHLNPTVDTKAYILDSYVASGNITTEPIPLGRATNFSVTVSCPATGSPAGTWKLQGCNDQEIADGKSDSRLVNWFDLASGGNRIVSAAVSNATTAELKDPDAGYRWFRVVYTRSSGSITATVKIQVKELA